jgi:hypothetical protein
VTWLLPQWWNSGKLDICPTFAEMPDDYTNSTADKSADSTGEK